MSERRKVNRRASTFAPSNYDGVRRRQYGVTNGVYHGHTDRRGAVYPFILPEGKHLTRPALEEQMERLMK